MGRSPAYLGISQSCNGGINIEQGPARYSKKEKYLEALGYQWRFFARHYAQGQSSGLGEENPTITLRY